jgi:hypothetical protein
MVSQGRPVRSARFAVEEVEYPTISGLLGHCLGKKTCSRIGIAGFLRRWRILAAIGMIREMGTFGHALLPELKLPMIATRDIGDSAAQCLVDLDFSGKQTRELLGERDVSMTEATAVIARGIGKPDLRYVQFPYDQVQRVYTQMGISPKTAALYVEMYKAINAGVVAAREPRSRENSTPTSFEKFVQDVFAPAYRGKGE